MSFRLLAFLLLLIASAIVPVVFLPTGTWQMAAQALAISLTFLLIIREAILWPVRRGAEWIKRLRQGFVDEPGTALPNDLYEPLAREIHRMADNLLEARAVAEKEAQLRATGEALWTPERLREHVRHQLKSRPLVVISNREPYQHTQNKESAWIVPPSGLVTALEPILRACGGLWIAQGTGAADRATVDANDKLRVPPDDPQYTLRRVWVDEEENKGYYYGFANEGLWPLCHIAHTRPLFRPEDWAMYQRVNERFAAVTLKEIEEIEDPYILVQDYHFALVPALIKNARPDAHVAMFWHIPWPNPESFGICPWRKELLEGLLGADLLGFHVQYHCNNFLDTVDRTFEARIDWDRYAVFRQGHSTSVKPFPISVATPWAGSTRTTAVKPPPPSKETLFRTLGIEGKFLGVGVDRLDYTKGIPERFRGIERFLELFPSYVGEFVFVELAAPSRSLIPRYKNLITEIHNEAQRINNRFMTPTWKPIVMMQKQHSHAEIEPFYKRADVCMVTSLHDGMNLVAKEFVAARDDGDGALILSPFTGASWELRDALIANPYDVDQLANALRNALEMPLDERRTRMRRMREVIRDRNIYRWGAALVSELSQIRLPSTPEPERQEGMESSLVNTT